MYTKDKPRDKLKNKLKENLKEKLKNKIGMSLIEVLIAMGVMSIAMMGFMQIMSNQVKQTRGLEETLARLDLEKTLANFLADGSICKVSLPGNTFNVTDVATTTFTVNSLPSSAAIGAGVLIEINKQASAVSNTLKINSIIYKNIQSTAIADKYNMDLEVSFKDGLRPLKPLIFKMLLNTEDASAGVKKVTGCNSSSMNANICASLNGVYNPTTGKCSGAGSTLTATECAALNGIYDSATQKCNDQGMQEYSGTTCPAGKQLILRYWDSRTCAGRERFCSISCTTAAVWANVAPVCIFRYASPSSGFDCSVANCVATTTSKVLCL